MMYSIQWQNKSEEALYILVWNYLQDVLSEKNKG